MGEGVLMEFKSSNRRFENLWVGVWLIVWVSGWGHVKSLEIQ